MSDALSPETSFDGAGAGAIEDPARRRSIFYVPLFESFDNYLPLTPEEKDALITGQDLGATPTKTKRRNTGASKLHISARGDSSFTESESDINVFSPEWKYRRPVSSTLSSNEALVRVGHRDLTSPRLVAETSVKSKPRLRSTTSCEPRYDRIYTPLGASISSNKLNSSTAIIASKSPSKSSIMHSNLSLIPDSPNLMSPGKEKSKTLPQNLNMPSPIRGSSSSTSVFRAPRITVTPDSSNKSPGKMSGLNFIRRSRSTKLSRSNSLLRSITSRHIEEGLEDQRVVTDLTENYDQFVDINGGETEVIGALIKKHEAQVTNSPLSIRRGYLDIDDDVAVHSGKIFALRLSTCFEYFSYKLISRSMRNEMPPNTR